MSSQASRIIWGIVAAVAVVILLLGVVFGPDLVRKGRAVAGPIMEISRAEDEGKRLEAEFPFTAPEDGSVTPERLEEFLSMREALAPQYTEMVTLEKRVEAAGENWQSAAEVLDMVRKVILLQNQLLREREMAPSEFRWLEKLTYERWLDAVEGAAETPGTVERLEAMTRDDLEHLRQVTEKYGASEAVRAHRRYLERRLAELATRTMPQVDGIPETVQQLLWMHHDRIARLRLDNSSGLHSRLSTADGSVRVELGSNDDD